MVDTLQDVNQIVNQDNSITESLMREDQKIDQDMNIMDFVDEKCNNLGSLSEALLNAFVVLAKSDIDTFINEQMMVPNSSLNIERNM